MSDDPPFEPPAITDEDIRWASRLLRLPDDAFHGETGTDPRQEVLKSMRRIDVAACPGSGKTTLLVAKLAILAEKWQHRTRGICVLSHTNAARHEIESRLGNSSTGQRLLAYPHFIGTIHAFVDEFLAIPWLRSRGFPITMIDTTVSLERRWRMLPHATQNGLERNHHSRSILSIKSADFQVGQLRWGRGFLGMDTPTYSNIRDACQRSISGGYHCYDEMFVWAGELMDKMTGVVYVLRDRFPMLFLDEAQDNSEEQSQILHRIFLAGNAPAIRQRFGDPNQAVFNSVLAKEATTDAFPDDMIKKNLPNSHRFGQKIADLADPLGIDPYGLVGHGPKKCLASGEPEAPHTIFLFDEDRVEAVLDAYADLLIETFSKCELLGGSFVAVGQVHRPPETEQNNKHPHHVGHYWPDYDSELTKVNPKPQSFVQYVLVGQSEAAMAGEAGPAVDKIAAGILRLAGMADGGTVFSPRRHKHRQVMSLLEDSADARDRYLDFVANFALSGNALSKKEWDERWCKIVQSVSEAVANATLSNADVRGFLEWKDDTDVQVLPSASPKSGDNIYSYPKDDPKVHIRLGSIHSVKGETHTATLVLETYWYDHNLEKSLDWLNGSRFGAGSAGTQQTARLKLHYVAMTRPTHLLCLAMKRGTFEKQAGELNSTLVNDIERRGWNVKTV